MKIFDSLEMTSETANVMHDTLCLSSIAESKEHSVVGGGGTGVPDLVSANISNGDDESPVFMTAKHNHYHTNQHHNTASTIGGQATSSLFEKQKRRELQNFGQSLEQAAVYAPII